MTYHPPTYHLPLLIGRLLVGHMARPRDKLKIILVQRLKSDIKKLHGQTPPVTCSTERIEIETRVIIACSYKKRLMR